MQRMISILSLTVGLALAGCGDKKAEATPAAPAQQQPSVQVTAAETAPANGDHSGKALFDANCISCHDASVFTRPDRKVHDFAELDAQVRRCDANLGNKLSDQDITSVIDYLNSSYYKFAH
jgi:cytochrome c5